jgi:chromosome segregation ATPase
MLEHFERKETPAMKRYTFPQKKIARVRLVANAKASELERLDRKISSLMAQVEKLKTQRCKVETAASTYKRLVEKLEAKYDKVEGSNVKQPLAAKFVVKTMSAKKGWLGVEYAVVT